MVPDVGKLGGEDRIGQQIKSAQRFKGSAFLYILIGPKRRQCIFQVGPGTSFRNEVS
jgi:hypothetical protein